MLETNEKTILRFHEGPGLAWSAHPVKLQRKRWVRNNVRGYLLPDCGNILLPVCRSTILFVAVRAQLQLSRQHWVPTER